MELSRRQVLVGSAMLAATAFSEASASAGEELVELDLSVDGDAELGRRFCLLYPRGLARGTRVPLVVLLHGLGETGDPRAGAHAWVERYGLTTAYSRLKHLPIERTSKRGDFTDARLAEINAELRVRPFGDLAFACPYTPNVAKMRDPSAALDRYAAWIADVVIPRARKDAPVISDVANTHLDGCSLGGYVGLEVFLRRPDLFGAWGGVQSAFGPARVVGYADRLARVVAQSKRRLHIETSEGDPFHDANVALARELSHRSVPVDLRVLPGPHDQPWLREAGTIEMLLFHERG